MVLYWEEIEDCDNETYVLYMVNGANPLGSLHKEQDNQYIFDSDFFNFCETYSEDVDGFSDIDELFSIIREDLMEDVKSKLVFMTEELVALGNLY